MAEKKYRVECCYKITSCEGEGDDHSTHEHTPMADGCVAWENLSYEDLVHLEGTMMAQITQGLAQLGLDELDNKKKKLK
jgi:hypothetical protein